MLLIILSQLGQHNQPIGSPVVYYRQFLDFHNLHLEVVQIFINQCKLYPGYLFKPWVEHDVIERVINIIINVDSDKNDKVGALTDWTSGGAFRVASDEVLVSWRPNDLLGLKGNWKFWLRRSAAWLHFTSRFGSSPRCWSGHQSARECYRSACYQVHQLT